MKNALYFSVNVFSIKVHDPIEDTKKIHILTGDGTAR